MCPTSWELLEKILTRAQQVVIILNIQTDDRDKLMIHQNSIPTFEPTWQKITDELNLYYETTQVPNLTSGQLGELILENAKSYRTSYTAEVKGMTEILDLNTTIKDPQYS